MIGRLEIERLRRHATDSLGERFSLQRFHDVVLGQGMTPFDELARTVDNWIARFSRSTLVVDGVAVEVGDLGGRLRGKHLEP